MKSTVEIYMQNVSNNLQIFFFHFAAISSVDKSSHTPIYIYFSFLIVNVFRGLFKNYLFVGILLVTSVLQVIMVEFGGKAMHVADGGLEGKYWGLSIGVGMGSLVVQQLINLSFGLISRSFGWIN